MAWTLAASPAPKGLLCSPGAIRWALPSKDLALLAVVPPWLLGQGSRWPVLCPDVKSGVRDSTKFAAVKASENRKGSWLWSTHSLYACCNWSCPYWASRDEGQKSLWNLLLVAVCSKCQLSLQLSVMQIQTRKGCHLSSEGLRTFWPQCQTWHMADFWMSQCGCSRPGILKEVPVQVSGCELLVPLEFSTLLKLLPATEASCHLSSEQLGSISEPLWVSRSMPATHPRQKDTFWHVTLTKLSAYSKRNWWRMEERHVQFLCHPPPSCSVFPYTCQLTLLQLCSCKMGTALKPQTAGM